MKTKRARVIGAGLIGTSIALRLKEVGWEVEIVDKNPTSQELAQDLLGKSRGSGEFDFVIVATPPAQIVEAIKTENIHNSQSTFIDVSSTKANTQLEIDSFPELVGRFVGTHPIAGREQSGAQAARSDLFVGRAWILTPSTDVPESTIASVESLISTLGATSYRMTPTEHDQLFARISHLPQLLSTALATSIEQIGGKIELSGQGLRDMLRLAGSSGELWSEILISNKNEVTEAISEFKEILEKIEKAIKSESMDEIKNIFQVGNKVQTGLSGKHGGKPRSYTFLSVVIEDRPGQLGALFRECAEVDANVEDLSLEHSPNQATGLIRLALSEEDASKLEVHLLKNGWRVHRQ